MSAKTEENSVLTKTSNQQPQNHKNPFVNVSSSLKSKTSQEGKCQFTLGKKLQDFMKNTKKKIEAKCLDIPEQNKIQGRAVYKAKRLVRTKHKNQQPEETKGRFRLIKPLNKPEEKYTKDTKKKLEVTEKSDEELKRQPEKISVRGKYLPDLGKICVDPFCSKPDSEHTEDSRCVRTAPKELTNKHKEPLTPINTPDLPPDSLSNSPTTSKAKIPTPSLPTKQPQANDPSLHSTVSFFPKNALPGPNPPR
ncbi:unnamed protein product [Moneuplotes crassus]|uniref:Uncharacterized protein n=1 Tax=Euplotes crassus TaxID=5936 RepID=A0AAD1XR91_EUPCR|nr:unnamed protein product [Moneuplotes crassus]